MHEHNLPLDYPEFVLAKEHAKNASQVRMWYKSYPKSILKYYTHWLLQIEYKKQLGETIQTYKGFQTMDSKEHPVVKQGIRAAELLSDVYWNVMVIYCFQNTD